MDVVVGPHMLTMKHIRMSIRSNVGRGCDSYVSMDAKRESEGAQPEHLGGGLLRTTSAHVLGSICDLSPNAELY